MGLRLLLLLLLSSINWSFVQSIYPRTSKWQVVPDGCRRALAQQCDQLLVGSHDFLDVPVIIEALDIIKYNLIFNI